jgi:hypothetical protein
VPKEDWKRAAYRALEERVLTGPGRAPVGFEILSPAAFDAGARYLLKRGYR